MFQITFDFDEKSKSITNIRVQVLTEEKKSTEGVAHLRLDKSKMTLSDELVTLLNINTGDRIAVNYVQPPEGGDIFPVIGKAEVFSNDNSGNKLTKSNTVSFRGLQNQMLNTHGSLFITELFKPGIYKLIPADEAKLQELNNQKSIFNLNTFNVE